MTRNLSRWKICYDKLQEDKIKILPVIFQLAVQHSYTFQVDVRSSKSNTTFEWEGILLGGTCGQPEKFI